MSLKVVKIETPSIPKEWRNAARKIEKGLGIAIVIGIPDSGKSTLAKFLTSYLFERGIKVVLLDADIGQSFIGPPTTIGLALFDPESKKEFPDWRKVKPRSIYSVGSTSPEGHYSIHIKGIKEMADFALSEGSEVVIIDTTGLVLGWAGKELKRRKVGLLSPRYILALERADELEHILNLYEDDKRIKIFRLPVSEMARPRSREERRIYRNSRFKEYFKSSKIKDIRLKDIKISGKVINSEGNNIPPERAIGIEGLLIGLKDSHEDTLALGIIDGFEKVRLRVLTPLKRIEKVRAVQLGAIRLNKYFEEEPF